MDKYEYHFDIPNFIEPALFILYIYYTGNFSLFKEYISFIFGKIPLEFNGVFYRNTTTNLLPSRLNVDLSDMSTLFYDYHRKLLSKFDERQNKIIRDWID